MVIPALSSELVCGGFVCLCLEGHRCIIYVPACSYAECEHLTLRLHRYVYTQPNSVLRRLCTIQCDILAHQCDVGYIRSNALINCS